MRSRASGRYHRDFKWYASLMEYDFCGGSFYATPCAYCGLPANTDDHVVPISFYAAAIGCVDMSEWRLAMVPACSECNCLAGNRVFKTVSQKRRFIQERLKCRYKKILEIPHWSEDEINELSVELARYVRHGLRLREIISKRITYRSRPAISAEKRLVQKDPGKSTAHENVEVDFTQTGSWLD